MVNDCDSDVDDYRDNNNDAIDDDDDDDDVVVVIVCNHPFAIHLSLLYIMTIYRIT